MTTTSMGHRAHQSRPLATALAALSIMSGIGLLLAPAALGPLYGLPPRRPLMRWLGLRDIAIGALTLSGQPRLGLAARSASDLADAALILHHARRHGHVRPVDSARVCVALLSSALAARG